MSKHCRKCGAILSVENTYSSRLRKCDNICKSCARKQQREYARNRYANDPEYRRKQKEGFKTWLDENREYHREYMRDYARQFSLMVNGKIVRVNKRPRPQECELCHKKKRYLCYHHWDDDEPSKGIWTCVRCHRIVELVDNFATNKIVQAYLLLKNQIEESYIKAQ